MKVQSEKHEKLEQSFRVIIRLRGGAKIPEFPMGGGGGIIAIDDLWGKVIPSFLHT